jgi:signal transduction histidine kinase
VIITAILFYLVLKIHLKKLRKAEHDAKESDRLKSAFLQNISHEIRTPMNGILGFIELLKSDDYTLEQKRNFSNIIDKSSKQLLSIIDEILTMSIIESGKPEVTKNSYFLNEIMDELYHFFKPQINENISFQLNKGLPDNSSEIFTDVFKLRQVLYNLLNNAVKFTENGYINFGYRQSKGMLEFFVEDSGVGINPEQHKIIFDRFTKAGKNTFKFYEGVGLGLSICKEIVEILGGKIWLNSDINKGSTFYFTIPFEKPETKQQFI